MKAGRYSLISGLIGLIGLGLCVLAWSLDAKAFFRAYLPAALFWTAIPLGSLALIMINQLTGGAWGHFARPALKAAAATLPLSLLLFVPLLFDLASLFPWIAPEAELAAEVEKKQPYLTASFFLLRTGIVFILWLVLAAALGVWRRAPHNPARGLSALGLILYGLTVSVYGIDWIMTLEPRWHSSVLGFVVGIGAPLTALSFAILSLRLANGAPAKLSAIDRYQDLGNLLLAGILLWSYLVFNDFLTSWSENLPAKIIWYERRSQNGWPIIAGVLVVFNLFLPALLLFSRRIKRSPPALAGIAGLVLVGRIGAAYWQVLPNFYAQLSDLQWLQISPFLAIGGLWLGLFIVLFARQAQVRSSAMAPRETVHYG